MHPTCVGKIMRKPIMVYSTLKKSQVIPVVPGALGTIPRRFQENVIGVNTPLGQIQKSALLGSDMIIRNVFGW